MKITCNPPSVSRGIDSQWPILTSRMNPIFIMCRMMGSTWEWGPRPLNSTGRHGLFFKLSCDMKPIDMGKIISDMTWAISYTRHATLGYFKIEMDNAHIATGDIGIY